MENKNQDLQLRAHSTGLIATINDPEQYRDVERGLSLSKVVSSSIPISVLEKNTSRKEVLKALDGMVTRLAASINLNNNLNDFQIKVIVEDLYDRYHNESLEDFMLMFKKARQGEFGTIYTLHSAVVFEWMTKYLEQKYQVIEDNLMRERDEEYRKYGRNIVVPENMDRDHLAEWAEAIAGVSANGIRPLTEEEIQEEGQEKPKREVHKFDRTEAQIRINETYRAIFKGQELCVRERHPEWSEEQIQERLSELKEEIINRQVNSKTQLTDMTKPKKTKWNKK